VETLAAEKQRLTTKVQETESLVAQLEAGLKLEKEVGEAKEEAIVEEREAAKAVLVVSERVLVVLVLLSSWRWRSVVLVAVQCLLPLLWR
jgi:hypothetical protein